MAILTKSGRIAQAELTKAQPLHMAWGPGDGAWTEAPNEDVDATIVTAELGRRTAIAQFVAPDVDGDIEIPGSGKFTVSVEPTSQLLVTAKFSYLDAPDATIRQAGVFMGTQVVGGLPAGQRYFTPAQLVSPGRLLQLQNRRPLQRDVDMFVQIDVLIDF